MNRDWSWGFNQFGTIRRCNLIIEKSQASTGLSDADKKALVAEGKMLRAMTYYYIAKHCGRVIWVDHDQSRFIRSLASFGQFWRMTEFKVHCSSVRIS